MRINLSITALLGALTVIMGVFGAHALKEYLDPDSLKSYETGVRYMMYHVIILLFINTYSGFTLKTRNSLSYIFFTGILFFSGSVFLISTGLVSGSSIWFITPIGGIFLIFGWIKLAYSFLKKEPKQ